jgi:hypothetical protein
MQVLGGERGGGGAEQEESDERSVHAGTYAGTAGTATNVHFCSATNVLRDTPASDAGAQERHWRTLTQLLAQAFGSAP